MADHIIWQKSSFSGADNNQNCIELADTDGQIMLRESDTPDAVVITSREKLLAFLLGVKAGEFDHLI